MTEFAAAFTELLPTLVAGRLTRSVERTAGAAAHLLSR